MEKLQEMLNNFKLKFEISRQLIISTSLFMVVFFVFFTTFFKTYESTVTILIIPKSQTAAIESDQIASNLAQITQTLSFYDRMLALNSDVIDNFSQNSQQQRKAQWNSVVRAEKIGNNSSILKISAKSKISTESNILVKKTVRTLFDTVSFYYNVKDDINLRIIDGPIKKTTTPNWAIVLFLSIFSSISTTFLVESIVIVFQKNNSIKNFTIRDNIFKNIKSPFREKTFIDNSKKNELAQIEDSVDAPYVWNEITKDEPIAKIQAIIEDNFEQVLPESKKETERITKIIKPEKYPNFSQMPALAKASAPDNLPVDDNSFLSLKNQAPANLPIYDEFELGQKAKIPEVIKEELDTKREPTQEELKKRLNQLLRGEL